MLHAAGELRRQAAEIERLCDELQLCCELKRSYQAQVAAEVDRTAEVRLVAVQVLRDMQAQGVLVEWHAEMRRDAFGAQRRANRTPSGAAEVAEACRRYPPLAFRLSAGLGSTRPMFDDYERLMMEQKKEATCWRDLFEPGWREKEAARIQKFLDAIPVREPLVQIGRRTEPCGECHLQPGERCDVCGARDVR